MWKNASAACSALPPSRGVMFASITGIGKRSGRRVDAADSRITTATYLPTAYVPFVARGTSVRQQGRALAAGGSTGLDEVDLQGNRV
jgi:hypothetical protein